MPFILHADNDIHDLSDDECETFADVVGWFENWGDTFDEVEAVVLINGTDRRDMTPLFGALAYGAYVAKHGHHGGDVTLDEHLEFAPEYPALMRLYASKFLRMDLAHPTNPDWRGGTLKGHDKRLDMAREAMAAVSAPATPQRVLEAEVA